MNSSSPKRLGDYCQLRNGYAFKSRDFIDAGTPVIRISDIQDGVINLSDAVSVAAKADYEKFSVVKGDILIAMSGATTGKYGVFDSDIKAYQNQRVGCFVIKDRKQLDKSFLYFLISQLKTKIESEAYGGGQPNISARRIEDYVIHLPSLDDQIHIANILSKAESLISQRKESIRLLDEFLKSAFFEIFGDPVRNEKRWKTAMLGSSTKIKHGFAFKSEYFSDKGPFVLLTPGNFFEEGGYRDRGEKQKFYTGAVPNGYLLNQGDLLIAMTEQAPGLLGSSIIIPESNLFLHNQRLGLVEYDRDKFNSAFLFFLFNSKSIRSIIHSKATGTKVRHTSPTKIEEMMTYYPPIEIQNRFAEIVDKTTSVKMNCQHSLRELYLLYGSLSQRAFNGALNLPESSVRNAVKA